MKGGGRKAGRGTNTVKHFTIRTTCTVKQGICFTICVIILLYGLDYKTKNGHTCLLIFTLNIPQRKQIAISALLYVACVQTKISYLYCKNITYIVKHSYCFTIRSDYSKNLYSKITDIVKGGGTDVLLYR